MADDYLTLADVAVFNDANARDYDLSDVFDDAPLLQRLSAITASHGNLHKYYKKTANPVVGFRAENDGREHDSAVRVAVTDTLKIFDASFTMDVAVARSCTKGPEFALGLEMKDHLKAAYATLEYTFCNGTANGAVAGGFDGLAQQADQLADANVVNAGGSANRTSVYLIRSYPDEVAVVAGNDGRVQIEDTIIQRIAGATTGHLGAYFTNICSWYGAQFGALYSVVRIANIAGATQTVTDDLIYSGLEKFPSSRPPNLIVMNRRSLFQLRDSRTATNATGAPAPLPADVEGIPILVTDGIGVAETAVA